MLPSEVVMLPDNMGYKSRKKKQASRQGYEVSRNDRRTREGKKANLEHLHAQLLVAGERIAQLREDLDKKAAETKEAKLVVSRLQAELATATDSFAESNRILRQKICRLKGKIRASRSEKLLNYGDAGG